MTNEKIEIEITNKKIEIEIQELFIARESLYKENYRKKIQLKISGHTNNKYIKVNDTEANKKIYTPNNDIVDYINFFEREVKATPLHIHNIDDIMDVYNLYKSVIKLKNETAYNKFE